MRYSSRGRVSTRFPSTNEIIYAIGIASTVDPGVKYESGGGGGEEGIGEGMQSLAGV